MTQRYGLDQIGTITNSGGTATLGGVLGDVANSSIANRLAIVEAAVTNIANVGSPSYAAPSSYTLTTGTQTSGTYANVDSDNDVYHVHTDTAGTLSLIYDWTLDADQQASSVIWRGRWNGTNDTLLFELYDWVGAAWVTWFTQVGVTGTTSAADITKETTLVAKYTGTGTNAGKVRVRITGSGLTSCTLSTDQLIVGKTTAAGGIANGSTITLAGSNTNKNYVGSNWTLALGGQDISGSYFYGAKSVTGISSGSTEVTFENCDFGAATIPPGKYINCGFGLASGTLTAASAGEYILRSCYSCVPGSGTPAFDWATGTGTIRINGRGWHGGSSHTIDGDNTISWEVNGGGGQTFDGGGTVELRGHFRQATLLNAAGGKTSQIVADNCGPIAINGAGGTVNIYGTTGTITDNSGGVVTITSTQPVNLANIAATVLGGQVVTKSITYNGSASYAAFTVTGLVAVKAIGYVTTALTNHADTTSVGTATSAAGLIAATAGTAMQTTGQAWVDNAPSKFETFPASWTLIGDGEDIAVVGTANITDGVVALYCWYVPISSGASVVAA